MEYIIRQNSLPSSSFEDFFHFLFLNFALLFYTFLNRNYEVVEKHNGFGSKRVIFSGDGPFVKKKLFYIIVQTMWSLAT